MVFPLSSRHWQSMASARKFPSRAFSDHLQLEPPCVLIDPVKTAKQLSATTSRSNDAKKSPFMMKHEVETLL